MNLPPHWHQAGTVVYRRSDGCEVVKSDWYSHRAASWRIWFAGYFIRHIFENRLGHLRGWQSPEPAIKWADKNIPFQNKSLEGPLIERN